MTKKKRSVWPWHLLTGLILLVLAWALWFSTSLISYEWRWNRVPQYFAYQAEEPLRANEIGRVEAIEEQGRDARVTLLGESGEKQVVTVAQDSLQFSEGDDVAEIIRAGVQSIARGQNEAARSLGLNAGQSMRYVILPQAFKRVLPPLAGQFISLVKDTSLVSVIAITELTKSGREAITTSFSTFEIWFCVAALYLLLNLPLSHMASRLERRLGQSD
ncbi:putative permease of ABC transporter [Pseudomonas aeruginosa DK2]|uniref:amino acid ABC transporter permease n=1 Tax=Pseudomonas aeruginosa TaxID=287 RepID=UPI000267E7FE|nr:amino acid ABC transporter permease [Pseudomonas aeruginosa]AFM67637.1 putative permease of ABC transporter [Pseudomonas aeruginosa DK2]